MTLLKLPGTSSALMLPITEVIQFSAPKGEIVKHVGRYRTLLWVLTSGRWQSHGVSFEVWCGNLAFMCVLLIPRSAREWIHPENILTIVIYGNDTVNVLFLVGASGRKTSLHLFTPDINCSGRNLSHKQRNALEFAIPDQSKVSSACVVRSTTILLFIACVICSILHVFSVL
jgi:hypothetical protein